MMTNNGSRLCDICGENDLVIQGHARKDGETQNKSTTDWAKAQHSKNQTDEEQLQVKMEIAWACVPNVTWPLPKIALQWTADGKKTGGRPKETWRRTVEKEMEECGLTWNTITKWAADRQQWRFLVDALCATGHEED